MLDKSNMPDDFNESSHNEPETWYKIVRSVAAEEGVDLSSHSGDELDLSHGENNNLPKTQNDYLIPIV